MIRVTKKFLTLLNRRQKYQALLLMILMLIGGVVESLSVSLMMPLIDAIVNSEGWNKKWYAILICKLFRISSQRQYLLVIIVVLIVVFVTKNAFLYMEYCFQYRFVAKGRYAIQSQLMRKYMYKPYMFFLNSSTAEIMRIVMTDTGQAFLLLTSVLTFYTEVIVAIILTLTIFVISPEISIMLAISLLLELGIIAKILRPILFKQGQIFRYEGGMINKWFLQSIEGIKSIKVDLKEEYFINSFSKHNFKFIEANRKEQTINAIPRMLIETFTVIVVLCYTLLSVIFNKNLMDIVPQLSAFVVAAMRLLPSVNKLSAAINIIPYQEPGLDNALNTLKDKDCDILERDRTSVKLSIEESIELKNMTFCYPDTKKKIFDHVTLKIRSGESIGLIGPSGAGKTTLVDIILGLLSINEGEIIIDGIDTKGDISKWLPAIAYIPQQIFLLDDSIRNNILFGEENTPENESKVYKAIKDASLEEFINTLPDGIDTEIGEHGVRLSGGQRQRIGIARALYQNPDVLFLDEATSALDNETELAIMESIDCLKGKKTLIIIAHRLSTIKNCDTVYKIENGKIKRQ